MAADAYTKFVKDQMDECLARISAAEDDIPGSAAFGIRLGAIAACTMQHIQSLRGTAIGHWAELALRNAVVPQSFGEPDDE